MASSADLRERLQSAIGSTYTLGRELGGAGWQGADATLRPAVEDVRQRIRRIQARADRPATARCLAAVATGPLRRPIISWQAGHHLPRVESSNISHTNRVRTPGSLHG